MDAFVNNSFKNESITGSERQLIIKERVGAQRSGYRSQELIVLQKAEDALSSAVRMAKTREDLDRLHELRNKVNQAEKDLVAAIYRRG